MIVYLNREMTMANKPTIRIERRLDEDRRAWIYTATGRLVGSPLCYEFLDEARERVGDAVPHVVVDVSGITMLNSTGIGIVASLCTSAEEFGGKVYLAGATGPVVRPLTATHMWSLVNRCDSLDDLPADL